MTFEETVRLVDIDGATVHLDPEDFMRLSAEWHAVKMWRPVAARPSIGRVLLGVRDPTPTTTELVMAVEQLG